MPASQHPLSITVSDYEINIDHFPKAVCENDPGASDYYAGDEVQNIGCFSAGELFIVQPICNTETGESILDEFGTDGDSADNGYIVVSVEDSKLHATSMSGQETYDDCVENQGNQDDDYAAFAQEVIKGRTHSLRIAYTTADNETGSERGTDGLDYTNNYSDGTDSALGGDDLRILAGYRGTANEDDNLLLAFDILIKFDDEVLEYDPSREIGIRGHDNDPQRLLFCAKEDGTGWTDDAEMAEYGFEDLVYFDTYDDAVASGKTVVGVVFETRDVQKELALDMTAVTIPVTVRNDAPVGAVAMTCSNVRAWSKSGVRQNLSEKLGIDVNDITYDDYKEYVNEHFPSISEWQDIIPKPAIDDNNGLLYKKSFYDEDGWAGGHNGVYEYGDSLYVLGERMLIDKRVAQQQGGADKSVFDLDYSQRYVDYVLQPAFDGSVSPSLSTDRTTDVTVVDELPSDLTYIPGSAVMGGTYSDGNGGQEAGTVADGEPIEPTAIRNDDGTTTLTWVVENVPFNSTIEPISFSCLIGAPGDDENDVRNNDEITNVVSVGSTYDKRDKRPEYRNQTSVAIRINKQYAQTLTIRPDPILNEISSELSFISSIGNYSSTSKVGIGINLMPYEDDGISDYSGTYDVERLLVTNDGDLSQLTFYVTTDESLRDENLRDIDIEDIESSVGTRWIECEFDVDTGTVTMPDGLDGDIVAWCVVDDVMSANERIDVETIIRPTGNSAGDTYGSRLSDGDNVVSASVHVLARVISGRMFIDGNVNDAYDEGEQLFKDARIRLVDDNGDVVTTIDGIECDVTTDANGEYEFVGVPAGSYKVIFSPIDGEDWRHLEPVDIDAVEDDVDSDAEPTTDGSGVLTSASIADRVMPDIEDIAGSLYESRHNDFGVRIDAAPHISVVKSFEIRHQDGCVDNGDKAHYGDTIVYSAIVTNDGDVPLTDVTVDDEKLGIDGKVIAEKLEPAASVEIDALGEHVVTVDDVRSGIVTNVVVANGNPPRYVTPPDETTDDVETPTTSNPSVSVVKATDVLLIENPSVGDEIPYTFTVTNTGDVPLSNLELTDAIAAIGKVELVKDSLLPGEQTTGTATYELTQADIERGEVRNTATVTGDTPSGDDVTGDSNEVVTEIRQHPSISLVKSTEDKELDAERSVVGEVISYDFTITNDGSVELHDVELVDMLDGVYDLTIDWDASTDDATGEGTLSVGESVSATAKYRLTQGDLNAGGVTNAAYATGTSPKGEDVRDDSSAQTTLTSSAAISLEKTASTDSISADDVSAGTTTIVYSFTIRNTGTVTLHDVTLIDEMLTSAGVHVNIEWERSSDASTAEGVMSPNETVSGSATYTVTQQDVANGSVVNGASVTGTPDVGQPVSDDDEVETTIETPLPHLSIVKEVDKKRVTVSSLPIDGDDEIENATLMYTFTVTNDGNVTLTDVHVSDMLDGLSDITVVDAPNDQTERITLKPSEKATFRATYVLTDADVTAGMRDNTATAIGTNEATDDVVSDPSTVETEIIAEPHLSIVKSVDREHVAGTDANVGTLLTYTFVVTNDGATTLSDVHVSDALAGLGAITVVEAPNDQTNDIVLAPGEKATFRATYALTQDDIEAGVRENTATAVGTDDTKDDVESDPSEVETTIEARPALSVEKSVSETHLTGDAASAGTMLTYTFVVTNTGNVTLTNVHVDDALDGLGDITIVDAPREQTDNVSLMPGESVTLTADYVLTQDDVEAGHRNNAATAVGTHESPDDVESDPSEVDTVIDAAPYLSIVKRVDKDMLTGDDVKPGTVLTYEFDVTNDGNVTLDGVDVIDALSGISEITVVAAPNDQTDDVTLKPSETVTFTATYAITQADIDAGSRENTAHAVGTYEDESDVRSDNSTVETTMEGKPHLSIVKKVDKIELTGDEAKAGSLLTYTFDVTNDGDVTLTDVHVADELAVLGDIVVKKAPGEQTDNITLKPGETATFEATYAITQEDVEAGHRDNIAHAVGTDDEPDDVTSDNSKVDTTIEARPHLTIVKEVDKTSVAGNDANPGTTLTYTFTVTNDGNVTLDNVDVIDDLSGLSEITVVEAPNGQTDDVALKPGETATFTATYAITQADIDAGSRENTAHAVGTHEDESDVRSDNSTVETTIERMPHMSIAKSVDRTHVEGADAKAGTVLTYEFIVTNDGNVTLDDVSVVDELDGLSDITVKEAPNEQTENVTLKPGESATFTATYMLTQDDVEAGRRDNIAHAVGTSDDADDVTSDDSEVSTTIENRPHLSIVKKVDKANVTGEDAKAGTTLTYTFEVTNDGNVALTNVGVVDNLNGLGDIEVVDAPNDQSENIVLKPGEKATFTATYQLTQADIEAGHRDNTAHAVGTNDEESDVTSNDSTVDTTIEARPHIAIVKKVDKDKLTGDEVKVGTSLTYEFAVTNDGNVTIDDINIIDELDGLGEIVVKDAPNGQTEHVSLKPGESATFTTTYAITQADIDAGHRDNVAHATGTHETDGDVTSDDSNVDTTIEAKPHLSIVKKVDKTNITGDAAKAGTTLAYTFEVTNDGNVTVDDVNVNDALDGLSDITIVSAPNDQKDSISLKPGEKATYTAFYKLTQDDVNAGKVSNTATAVGTHDSDGDVGSDPSATETTIERNPSIIIEKTVDKSHIDDVSVGDTLTYGFTVTNTGNVPLTDVAIDDAMLNAVGIDVTIDWGKSSDDATDDGTLSPNEAVSASAAYKVTQVNIDAGKVANVATAHGTDGDDDVVSEPSDVETTLSVPKPPTPDQPSGDEDGDGNENKPSTPSEAPDDDRKPSGDATVDVNGNGNDSSGENNSDNDGNGENDESNDGSSSGGDSSEDTDSATPDNALVSSGSESDGGMTDASRSGMNGADDGKADGDAMSQTGAVAGGVIGVAAVVGIGAAAYVSKRKKDRE